MGSQTDFFLSVKLNCFCFFLIGQTELCSSLLRTLRQSPARYLNVKA